MSINILGHYMAYVFQAFLRLCMRGLMRLGGKTLVVERQERIQNLKGPFLIVSNHRHAMDAFHIGMALPYTWEIFPVHFLATRQFKTRPLAILTKLGIVPLVYKLGGVITITRKIGIEKSLVDALAALKSGKTIVMFPEGTRNMGAGELLPIRDGAAYLATMSGVPILPLFISYTENTARIRFGNVFYLTDPDYKKGTPVIHTNLLSLAKETISPKTRSITEPAFAYK